MQNKSQRITWTSLTIRDESPTTSPYVPGGGKQVGWEVVVGHSPWIFKDPQWICGTFLYVDSHFL